MNEKYFSSGSLNRRKPKLFPSVKRLTGDRLQAFCKKGALKLESHHLKPGHCFPDAKLHIAHLGPETAGGILLYFHGGGYAYPASDGHFKLSRDLAPALACDRFAMLEYTLLPKGTYPTQLAQAVEALRTILGSHEPQQIVLAGDSAGGNLALSLLAHLKSPHPNIEVLDLSSPLAAVICISPRCSNAQVTPSYSYNAANDIVDPAVAAELVAAWQPAPDDVWSAANNDVKKFWLGGRGTMTSQMLILAGDQECYLDDIRNFANTLDAKEGSEPNQPDGPGKQDTVKLVVVSDTGHAQIVLDYARGVQFGRTSRELLQWASRNQVKMVR